MQIIDGSTLMTHILWAGFNAELLEDLDSQALEADELHHIELGGLSLQDLQRRHTKSVPGAEKGPIVQEVLKDWYAVVFLKNGAYET